ncbi:MAG TPA: alkaline phosphatase family protein [Candidatus Cybelea sp.]|jgi:phospholipase C|nr:alkaline phosphatase family protein [Candidatus Cybelea sp.]
MRPANNLLLLALLAAGVSCSGQSAPSLLPGGFLPQQHGSTGSSSPIKHVVILIQENRSFDNFFSTFPGADGTKVGKAAAMTPQVAKSCFKPITEPTTIPLTEVDLQGHGFPSSYGYQVNADLGHIYDTFQTDYDKQHMDGFDNEGYGARGSGGPACTYPYQYVNPDDIAPYWDMAKQYVLSDHMFQTQGSGSFTAHQDLIAAGTGLSSEEALIDTPSYFPWGCDGNPSSLVTSVIKRGGQVLEYGGPFPCLSYTTLRDLLDAQQVSWKYYAVRVYPYTNCPKCEGAGIWSAFDAIKAVRNSPEWKTNVSRSPNAVFGDIKKNKLPAVAWITPTGDNSDHPATGKDTGPSWIASVVNAIGQSSYWNSTAIVIVWDDWGGFYDHVKPPTPRNWQGGPGFRVPMLIVSPYVKPHVVHTVYEFGSILRFIEDNWNLGTLGRNDAHATSIRNAFDYNMAPRPYKVISSKYSRSFFLHQVDSGRPPDTE